MVIKFFRAKEKILAVHTKRVRRLKRGSGRSSSSSAIRADRSDSVETRAAQSYASTADVNSEMIRDVSGVKKARDLEAELNDRKVDLIKADLDASYTFASIACQANDGNKRMRNRKNARKGYDTVLHFLTTAKLTQGEAAEIDKGIARLKQALVELGEISPH